MPTCKNDPSKKYKDTEPSPKGIGWCAHSEKEGKVRKGKDGKQWIVKKVKNGSKRWVKKNTINLINLYNYLEKKISKFWYKIVSEHNFIIIKKNNSYKKVTSKMKYSKAKYNELNTLMNKYNIDKDVNAILTSGPSSDNLTFFIFYLLTKSPIKIVEDILNTRDITTYICHNYKLFFKKSYNTGKEYSFKWNDNITIGELNNNSKYMNRLKKNKIIQKYI